MHPINQIRTRQLIVALCALFLLGTQQAAFVHLLGHFRFAAATATQPGNQLGHGASGHGASSNLPDVCATCLAFTALAAAAPLPVQFAALAAALAAAPVLAAFSHAPAQGRLPYAARAPPQLL